MDIPMIKHEINTWQSTSKKIITVKIFKLTPKIKKKNLI